MGKYKCKHIRWIFQSNALRQCCYCFTEYIQDYVVNYNLQRSAYCCRHNYNSSSCIAAHLHTHTQITQQHPEQAPPSRSPAHWLAQPIREHYTLIQWETEEAKQWQENGQSEWSQSWNAQHFIHSIFQLCFMLINCNFI